MSTEEYYSAFTRITSQLGSMVPKSSPGCEPCEATEEFEQQTLMYNFVMKLRHEYENIHTQLLGRTTSPTLT
jgi:hypothetical protein